MTKNGIKSYNGSIIERLRRISPKMLEFKVVGGGGLCHYCEQEIDSDYAYESKLKEKYHQICWDEMEDEFYRKNNLYPKEISRHKWRF